MAGIMNEELTEDLIAKLLNITIPDYPARAGWTFNTPAITQALKELKIERPVRFKFSAGRQTIGTHRIIAGGKIGSHLIVVSQDLSIKRANETIWHELAHASQAESYTRATGEPMISFYRHLYKLVKGEHGSSYENNKLEQHARMVSDKYKERMLLK